MGRTWLIMLSALLLAAPAQAAVTAAEAQRLRGDLTPVGAERAGNADGTLPAWQGGLTEAPPGYRPGDPRPDPFAGERPLFSITAANLAQHEARLPEGQKALFARDADYRMDIYPSHRTAAAPQAVYDAILANATRARPAPDGLAAGVAGAVGGIPFPIPANGGEVVWNHLLAWWGVAREGRVRTWLVAADGSLELTNDYRETVDFPYYYPGATPDGIGGYFFKRREVSLGPPALAGRGYIAWQPLDSGRDPFQAWQYLPGQRRVRKAAALAYDAPTPDGGGIQSFDDYYVFSGSPDRYVFTLLGKREMYVPYNNNGFTLKPVAEVARPRHVDPGSLRYELHRVWIVDAVLAPGARHLLPHRRLYIDEDSWMAVYAEGWDADGRLWKFTQATMYTAPDVPAVVAGTTIINDIPDGGYVLGFAFGGLPVQFRATARHPASDFEPETLAAEQVR
jgi:hypothetical protein